MNEAFDSDAFFCGLDFSLNHRDRAFVRRARNMRFLLAATIMVLLSADASAYTFAFTKEHRLKIVGYCFDGFDGCMRRGQARGVDQKTLPRVCQMACRMRARWLARVRPLETGRLRMSKAAGSKQISRWVVGRKAQLRPTISLATSVVIPL